MAPCPLPIDVRDVVTMSPSAKTHHRSSACRALIRVVVEINSWCVIEDAEDSIEKAIMGLEEVADVHVVHNVSKGDAPKGKVVRHARGKRT